MSFKVSTSRRDLLLGVATVPLVGARAAHSGDPLLELSGSPAFVAAFTESGRILLKKNGTKWQGSDIELSAIPAEGGLELTLSAPTSRLLRIQLRWLGTVASNYQFLGDQWERSYGDLGWRTMDPERILPWYVLAFDGRSTFGIGVKTGTAGFCFWQVDPAGISLWLDVRNGGRGVRLGKRELRLATITSRGYANTRAFSAARQFCGALSSKPRLPAMPVYGGNNWYYAYGKSSAQAIQEDSERISSLSTSSINRPFMVIDDGWQLNPTAGPWAAGNSGFPDMQKLAVDMRSKGVRPGLWIRPLFTKGIVPPGWRLNSPSAAREFAGRGSTTLDPTVPEAAASIAEDVARTATWGYELLKHDFSTYDLLGRWGFRMGSELTDSNWGFADESLTNAEVIHRFYQLLRKAAGASMLLGCNTVGHLGAGIFELSRTGDDTSGRDWNRTRKMGVNTLAFRAPQHGTFFAVDADCVGITNQISWKLNRQWLDLLARSGTPLFVSAAPEALGKEERAAVQQAFTLAAAQQPLIEPLDWLTNTEPERWMSGRESLTYRWFGQEGPSPFAT